jgi:tetratricopeptide (TPR) repeat protein
VLPLILAHARAGALTQAWRLFREAGFEGAQGEPAVLAVRGRLLKEEALGARGAERARLQRQAAEAYAAAGALSGETYHLINAATLWRLSGEADAAADVAAHVLESLDRNPDEAETPYWRGATRSEALLLLGRGEEARDALRAAVALAPRAWEDHAATLRQFRLICEAQGADAGWLDALRPPRAAHFAGHMSLPADDPDLKRRVADVLAAENVGFGFGALAAGADIVVAEALVARAGELHLVLPASRAVFREASVSRQGDGWGARYDALLEAAAIVECVGDGAAPNALAVQLAAEVAMGQAAMHARALQTEAIQLLVLDLDERGGGGAGGSGWARDLWAASGRRQQVIQAPRHGRAAAPIPKPAPGERLLASLSIAVDESDLPALAKALRGAPVPATPPAWTAGAVQLAFPRPAEAAAAALAALAVLGARVRIGGHYATARSAAFPGADLTTGEAASLVPDILAVTPPGAAHVSAVFAAAACAADAERRVEPAGDMERPGGSDPLPLYALRA